jgi:hypothetical protein
MSKERKTLVTAAGPMMTPLLRNYSLPSFQAFGRAQGYETIAHSSIQDSHERQSAIGRGARWAKIDLLRKALRQSDVGLWVDADVIICRTDEDIANLLRPDSFQGLVLESVPSQNRINPNTGVWLMRNCPKAFDFLDEIEEVGPQPGPWMDQGSALKVLGWERGEQRYNGARPGIGNEYTLGTTWFPVGWNQPFTDRPDIGEVWHDRPTVPYPYAVHFLGMKTTDERAAAMAHFCAHMADRALIPPAFDISQDYGAI